MIQNPKAVYRSKILYNNKSINKNILKNKKLKKL